MIYGKTVMSMSHDIKAHYDSLLSNKDSSRIAGFFYSFFKENYPDIYNLLHLLNLIGCCCSKMGNPVLYSTKYIPTIQDYMYSKKANIWIFYNKNKKRRRLTLRVPTEKRDSRKTLFATCANLIHQKDAYIA